MARTPVMGAALVAFLALAGVAAATYNTPTCDVCWEWSLDTHDPYFHGHACDSAMESIYSTMWQLHKKYPHGGLIVDGFTKHDIECDGNSVYVCGSFKNEWAAKTFVSIFYKYFSTSYKKCGVPVASDFCDANPGAVISLTSHSSESKYDHTWSYSKGWKPSKCNACDISAEVKCPVKKSPPPPSPKKSPPPPKVYPCEVCYEWTIQTWKGDYCDSFDAAQIADVVQIVANGTIYEGFTEDHVKCEGNSVYICGSFKSKEAGRAFVYRMTKEFSVEAQIEVAFEGDIAAFCEKYPGKTITLTSHDWDKYDHTWGYGHWNTKDCSDCELPTVSYTCAIPSPPPRPSPRPPSPKPKPTCNVCWEWTLAGCGNNWYGSGKYDHTWGKTYTKADTCQSALSDLHDLLTAAGYADFIKDSDCSGNKMWVCGAFQTEYEGASLKDMLMKQLDERGLILLGTGHDGFCDQYPGAVVSVKSRTWDDKYYHTWSWGWYKPSYDCKSCDIDLTWRCPVKKPSPPPPKKAPTCDVCWEWTVDKCEDKWYYGASRCHDAKDQILTLIHYVNDKLNCFEDGFDEENSGCDGNTVYVCGSFRDQWAAKNFVDTFRYALSKDDQCGVAVADEFCYENPKAVIKLRSYSWDKYDHTWTNWQSNKCQGCELSADVKCSKAWKKQYRWNQKHTYDSSSKKFKVVY